MNEPIEKLRISKLSPEILSKDVLSVLKRFFDQVIDLCVGALGKKLEDPRTMFELVLRVEIRIVRGV